MKNLSFCFQAIVLILIIPSCETTEKIDDFPLRPSKLVVNCLISPYNTWELQISQSLSVLDNAELKLIENATINIYKKSELIASIDAPDSDHLYRSSDYQPVPGEDYFLEVSSPDFESIAVANDSIPQAVKIIDAEVQVIDSIFQTYINEHGIQETRGYAEGLMNIIIEDTPEVENYYELSVIWFDSSFNVIEDSIVYNIKRRRLNLSTEDISAQDDESDKKSLLFNDKLFDGKNYRLKVDFIDKKAILNKNCLIQLATLSKSAYLYQSSFDDYMESVDDPFSEPVIIYGNIENGYGIFAGYSTDLFPVRMYY